MIEPRFKPAIVFAILGLSLTGAILGSGIGRQDIAKGVEPPVSAVKISMPPSTVIHPPMICKNGGCAELKAGPPAP